jgi:hypothetical protein
MCSICVVCVRKSQGKTLTRAVVDIRCHIRSQPYIALSRVRSSEDSRILCNPSSVVSAASGSGDESRFTWAINVVERRAMKYSMSHHLTAHFDAAYPVPPYMLYFMCLLMVSCCDICISLAVHVHDRHMDSLGRVL